MGSIGPHHYKHLDATDGVRVTLSLPHLAEEIESLNYGTQRFLSNLVDVRRRRHAARIAQYRARGDDDTADYVARSGDPLADGIEALLKDGLF